MEAGGVQKQEMAGGESAPVRPPCQFPRVTKNHKRLGAGAVRTTEVDSLTVLEASPN